MALRLFLIFITINFAYSQNYWQQHVDYQMDIDMNVEDFTFKGTQKIVYTNNSPDTLNKVYYHLFFNAFRPGSQMDVRSRTIKDPDRRVRDRIFNLSKEDYGALNVSSIKQNSQALMFQENETILLVRLEKPLLPGKKTTLNMVFEGQVPQQIRRSGKMSKDCLLYTSDAADD